MTAPLGSYFVEREQPELSAEEAEVVRRFSQIYYDRWSHAGGADTINLSWLGHLLLKSPLDLWIYQELLVRTQPDFVVETGTYCGGSALFFATIFDQIGHGTVITIDVTAQPNRPEHRRITYVTGSSTDAATVEQVRHLVGPRRALVALDSDHGEDHVYRELSAYSPLVQAGDYLVVEDTNINGHPVLPDFGPGPAEAVTRFLAETDQFELDRRCERFLMTLQPNGYLRRKSRPEPDIGRQNPGAI